MIAPFRLSRVPEVAFGEGSLQRLPEIAASFGKTMLLVTGASSLEGSRHWGPLIGGLERQGISWQRLAVSGEPSPEIVDEAVARFRDTGVDVVAAVGGGSVLDAAKAVAGLLPHGNSVMDHLEGVGRGIPYTGPAVPLIAAPTTAGTGSEATKNSVLSRRGSGGFKKSFRHESLVPRFAIVDPDLLETCPAALIAADGMDCVTQLIESYVSSRANPFTDALAESGLRAARLLVPWHEGTGDVRAARSGLAYAAFVSGVTLAQTGLGAVHGLASPLGGFFPIPHGVVCGTLLATSIALNVGALRAREPEGPTLAKYARVHTILAGGSAGDPARGPDALVALLGAWERRLGLPKLGVFGVRPPDLGRIVASSRGGSMKTNPIVLTDAELERILVRRL